MPQQNGLAERVNRTIAEMARSMIYYQHVDKSWWGEAVHTAVYLINRIPNTARADKSPYEMMLLKKPSLDHLRVFGARGFVHVDKSKRTKWDKKAHRCIFLGYADGSKAYRVWDVENDCFVFWGSIALDERPPSACKELLPASDERTVLVNFPNDEPVVVSGIRGPRGDGTPMKVDEELKTK
jgi:hypothetical protein